MAFIKQFAERITAPTKDPITGDDSMATKPWVDFFSSVAEAIVPLGTEKYFQLVNNQTSAATVTGLSFSKKSISQAIVDFLIQRVTTGSGATEIVTSGTFHLVYKPTSDSWALVIMGAPGPSTSGITFTVTALGQVQYTSTNITGTASISKLAFRYRTLGAKSFKYSSAVI